MLNLHLHFSFSFLTSQVRFTIQMLRLQFTSYGYDKVMVVTRCSPLGTPLDGER